MGIYGGVNRWHRQFRRTIIDVDVVNNITTATSRHLGRRTPPLESGNRPSRFGGISGCLRIREFGDWLRSVDELNGVRSAASRSPRWSDPGRPESRAASASTDDRGGPGATAAASGGGDVDAGGRRAGSCFDSVNERLPHEVAAAALSVQQRHRLKSTFTSFITGHHRRRHHHHHHHHHQSRWKGPRTPPPVGEGAQVCSGATGNVLQKYF